MKNHSQQVTKLGKVNQGNYSPARLDNFYYIIIPVRPPLDFT